MQPLLLNRYIHSSFLNLLKWQVSNLRLFASSEYTHPYATASAQTIHWWLTRLGGRVSVKHNTGPYSELTSKHFLSPTLPHPFCICVCVCVCVCTLMQTCMCVCLYVCLDVLQCVHILAQKMQVHYFQQCCESICKKEMKTCVRPRSKSAMSVFTDQCV